MLTARELEKKDIEPLVSYWINAPHDYLMGMGVDLSKMPTGNMLTEMLMQQLPQRYEDKKSYCIIWEADEEAIGHSNINKIIFGEEAYMHLHIWKPEARNKGYGKQFIQLTLPFFFKNMKLKNIYCEPYALNPAPNKTLEKAGFQFVKTYFTVPGSINFEQEVNLWKISRRDF